MARRATHKETPEVSGLNETEFRRVVGEINRQKQNASEYTGAAGKLTRDTIERLSLQRDAFAMFMRVNRMDPAKQHASISAFLDYIEKGGCLDQVDAFNDLAEKIVALGERLSARSPKQERIMDDPHVKELMQ